MAFELERDIYLMDITGGEPVCLNDGACDDPSARSRLHGWLPDSETVLISTPLPNYMDVETGDLRLIAERLTFGLQLSPDASQLLLLDSEFNLGLIPAEGGDVTYHVVLPQYASSISVSDWSPDGEWLAYHRRFDFINHLHVRNLQTGEDRQIRSEGMTNPLRIIGWMQLDG